MGYYNFTGNADWHRTVIGVNNLHDYVFGGNMHSAVRALMGNKARIPPAVTVGSGTAEASAN